MALKEKSGRPYINIDMKVVDDLLAAGCNGSQIANYIGVHHDTLYNRIQDDYNITFTEYSVKKRQKGESMLHASQFKKAMSGDTSMLIWLGKNRLGQKDKSEEAETKELIIKTLQYIDAQRNNPTPQIHATEISTTDTPSS